MSIRYKGGILSATPPTLVAGAGASGAWTLEQQMQATAAGLWPVNGPFYIEDVFSTWLYTGNGGTQTITNGIDLATYGGLWWGKGRSNPGNLGGHGWVDTVRGKGNMLQSNTASAPFTTAGNEFVTSFNTTGVTIGNDNTFNRSGELTAGWTFRKQPKFFDVLSYTGNGTTQTINHNLGAVPGFVIIRRYSGGGGTGDWDAWHRGSDARFLTGGVTGLFFNTTDPSLGVTAYGAADAIMNAAPTATTLNVKIPSYASSSVNAAGMTYIAYLFAHNAGGFGLTGADNVISCGSYTGNGSATGPVVTLGYEPQWIMIKDVTDAGPAWAMFDNMRGIATGSTEQRLYANTSGAEVTTSGDDIDLTATGFNIKTSLGYLNTSGSTFIYIAIRRGPMKTPTVGTSVFSPLARTGTGTNTTITAGFPIDMMVYINSNRAWDVRNFFSDRLRDVPTAALTSTNTSAETSLAAAFQGIGVDSNTGVNVTADTANAVINRSGVPYVNYFFGRAPGFFDVVCYTGTGGTLTLTHNLGVVPELMIGKSRNTAGTNWAVYTTSQGLNSAYLNRNIAFANNSDWSSTPTATQFTVPGGADLNASSQTQVMYLFATCPGVSKVGSYTGTGALQTVNCGFTTGARYVLIKRTDTTGDWYSYDSSSGITSGNDPYMLLNSTAAQVTGTNYVDTDTTGFKVTAAAPAGLNASGGTYIFLAIA